MSTSKRPRPDDKAEEDETPVTDSTEHFYADGDIMIISSDNVRYKVHKYHLQAASTVFRHMLGQSNAGDSNETIRLYDTEIEDSTALDTVFNTFCKGVIPDPFEGGTEEGPLTQAVKAWRFFNKYECILALGALTARVEAGVWGEDWANAFIFGAATNQIRICECAVEHVTETELGDWDDDFPEDLRDWGRGSRDNIFGQPYDKLKLAPLEYLMAFQRATQTPMDDPDDSNNSWKVRQRFRALINTVRGN